MTSSEALSLPVDGALCVPPSWTGMYSRAVNRSHTRRMHLLGAGLVLALTACNAKPKEQAPAALPPLASGVVLTVKLSFGADHKATVSGDTNLPDGTRLTVGVKEAGQAGVEPQSPAAVSAGRYTAGGIGPEGGYHDGTYLAEVVMPAAAAQPDTVRAVIGAQGEKLTGKLVKGDVAGPTVVARASAVLGR